MKLRILILSICLVVAGYTQAQEVVFKVKKPTTRISVSPPGEVLWLGEDNPICITSDNNIKIAKVEAAGVTVTRIDNNNYMIRLKDLAQKLLAGDTPTLKTKQVTITGNTIAFDSIGNVTEVSTSTGVNETTLLVYEELTDGSQKLVFTKKYKIKWPSFD